MRSRLALLVLVLAFGGLAAADARAAATTFFVPGAAPAHGTPPGFRVGTQRAIAIARSQPAIGAEQRGRPTLGAHAFVLGDSYVIEFFSRATRRAEVLVNGGTGKIISITSGRELAWPQIFHGLHGPYARRMNVILVGLGLVFLLPFLDLRRRRFGWLHADLLALLSLGASFGFSIQGNIDVGTPLFYPPLLYLIARMAYRAMRPAADGADSWMPSWALGAGLVAILAFRYVMNIVDGPLSDIGYASLFGADSITHGYQLYDASRGSGNLDTYGPVMYLAYVPFTWLFPFDLTRAHVEAARAATISFDLLTVAGLMVLARSLAPAGARLRLALLLGWGYAAFPFTYFALSQNTNDGLVAALLVWALVVAATPALRGFVIGLAAAAKFAPAVLAGVFLRVRGERGRRDALIYVGVLALTVVVLIGAFLPDGGLREFYDATLGFQFHRKSPFSMWGLHPSWSPLHVLLIVLAAALAIASLALPRERGLPQLAAAGAALVIAAQLTAIHWYFFYIPWFLPYALVALLSRSYAGSVRNSGSSSASAVASNSS